MVPGFIVFGKEGIAMALTIGQEKCVNTLDKPLAVSAGAGSGKTFTLTPAASCMRWKAGI